MAENKKISDLDDVPAVDGSETIPVVKSGLNFKLSVNAIRNFLGVANSTRDGLMASTDKIKLSNIAEGATANASDTILKDRANHTGTQAANTITGLGAVATSNQYADLTGKPDLTAIGLGFAPVSHIGAGGTSAHPLATDTMAGFMPPELYSSLLSVKPIAFTADYNDLINTPAPGEGGGGGSSQKGGHQGFSWFADSNQLKGSSLNDYNSFGTGAYVAIQATGTTFRSSSEHHSFTSAADTYSIAGLRSAQPMFKRTTNEFSGGFVFETIVGWDYVANSCLIVGLSPNQDKAYQNWGNGDKGIAVGWDSSSTGTSKLKIFTADGTSYTATEVDSGTIGDNGTYYISITMKPNMTSAYVTVVNLDTGAYLANAKAISTTLPPLGVPMYCMTEYGTLSGAAPVVLQAHAISALLTGVGSVTVAPADVSAITASLSSITTSLGTVNTSLSAINTSLTDVNSSLAGKLSKSGGIMTGAITLSADAVNPLEPVTLQQLNAKPAGGLPLLHSYQTDTRDHIEAGEAPQDGQLLSRALFPDAWAAIQAKRTVITDAAWLADPLKRGNFSSGDGSTTFRIPDKNGKSSGSIGALVGRGDGLNSAGTIGLIQSDATRLVKGSWDRGTIGPISDGAVTTSGPFYLDTTKQMSTVMQGVAVSTGYARALGFDNSLVVPTAAENRVANVTTCWVIKLAGSAFDEGQVNALALATEITALTARVATLESHPVPTFTILYPGGTEAAPANITLNQRIAVANPFSGRQFHCRVEILSGGVWGEPDFGSNIGSGSNSFGVTSVAHNDGIVVISGVTAVGLYSSMIGNGFSSTASITTAPFRVKVWTIN